MVKFLHQAMNTPPATKISLIETISNCPDSARWTEFCRTYEQPMHAYLASHYPSVDADDIIQETMIALIKALPNYRYDPDTRGHFRNYLTGILRHKAVSEIRRRQAESDRIDTYGRNRGGNYGGEEDDADMDSLRKDIFEAAVTQLMADDSISSTTREIFRHVALMQEPPAKVAAEFGTTRNNVDQIKRRMIVRLSGMVRSMNLPLASS